MGFIFQENCGTKRRPHKPNSGETVRVFTLNIRISVRTKEIARTHTPKHNTKENSSMLFCYRQKKQGYFAEN